MRKEIFESEEEARELLNYSFPESSLPPESYEKIISEYNENGLIKKSNLKSAEKDYYKFLDSFNMNDSYNPDETLAHKYIKELEKELNACNALNNTEKYINNMGHDEKKTSETQE